MSLDDTEKLIEADERQLELINRRRRLLGSPPLADLTLLLGLEQAPRPVDEEPIYEKLAPGEAFILSATPASVLIACNIRGNVVLKRLKAQG